MSLTETHRKIAFVAALATLIAGVTAMALFDGTQEEAALPAASRVGQALAPAAEGRRAPGGGAGMRDVALSAGRFVRAYLRYEAGTLRSADRESLTRYSTPQLGGQLLRAPVRIPPGSRLPRQFVARIAAVQAGLFEGMPALLVSIVVAGSNGTHLLRASVIKRHDGWVVAGVGP